MTAVRGRPLVLCLSVMAFAGFMSLSVTAANQQTAAPPPPAEPLKGEAIRGCLAGSKLTHIDQDDSAPLPDPLAVTTIRVIRDQLKALHGHYVEVIGTLRNISGQETGLLVAESDKGRFYIGGGDTRLGEDLRVTSSRTPAIHAHTIRDLATECPARQPN
jgi:hypothetical protein